MGLKKNDFNSFTLSLSEHLAKLTDFGSLFLVSKQDNDFSVSFSINCGNARMKTLGQLLDAPIPGDNVNFTPVPGSDEFYRVYPVNISHPGEPHGIRAVRVRERSFYRGL